MNQTQDEAAVLQRLEEIHTLVRFVCGKTIVPCLCFIGFFANVLNVLVLTRSWMSSSTNVYLTAVAVCDVFYLVVTYLFYLKAFQFIQRFGVYMYAVPFLRVTANLFSNTTTWLTVCFTIERYIAVSSPMLGRRFCTQQRARYAVGFLCLISFVFTFPDYLKDTVVHKSRPISGSLGKFTNETSASDERIVDYAISDLPTKRYLILIGYDYINQILFVLVPLILLIIFNSLLIRTVIEASKDRQGLVQRSTKKPSNSLSVKPEFGLQHMPSRSRSLKTPAVTDALEASMQTTVELASGISQAGTKFTFSRRRPIFGEQQRITMMLITIVIAFVLLQLPSIVPTVMENLWKAKVLEQTQIMIVYTKIYSNISNVLLVMNAAMNFVFYSLFSAKFRQTCYALFQQCECCGSAHIVRGWQPVSTLSRSTGQTSDRNLVRRGSIKRTAIGQSTRVNAKDPGAPR
ncbi:FMRFamide receptor [Clonorchis sinensis]|uniref:FMRFamide receptor n=1 Tax=Clonorchis sinensis TaxID=79923 RepID=H2KSE8_CLOSI|nr:FMRFamide receptor [Clonorchis sinensis]